MTNLPTQDIPMVFTLSQDDLDIIVDSLAKTWPRWKINPVMVKLLWRLKEILWEQKKPKTESHYPKSTATPFKS